MKCQPKEDPFKYGDTTKLVNLIVEVWSYDEFSKEDINFVALLCTFSKFQMSVMSPISEGFQIVKA